MNADIKEILADVWYHFISADNAYDKIDDAIRAAVEADRQQRGGLVGYIRQADIDWLTAPDRDKTAAMQAYVYKSARYSNEPDAMHRVPVYAAPPASRTVPTDDVLRAIGATVGLGPSMSVEYGRALLERCGQPAASAEPVGTAYAAGPMYMRGTTVAAFDAADVPAGSKLYVAPVTASAESVKELLRDARHRIANLSRASVPFDDPLDGPVLRRLDAAIAAPAQPTMPQLTDAMRAVLRNENDVYGDEDALYSALCDAAQAQPVAKSVEQDFENWCDRHEYDRTKRLDGTGYNNPATARAWAAWQDAIAWQPSAQDREDAERWREVAERFDQSKTSACERVLDALGLDDRADKAFELIIDAARATKGRP